MKKALLIPILCACIVFGCSNDTTTTDSSYCDTCSLTQSNVKKVSFVVDGFGKTNLLIDFDVRVNEIVNPADSELQSTSAPDALDNSYYYEARAGGGINKVKVGDEADFVGLEVIVPKMETGEYSWGGTSNSTLISKSGENGVAFIRIGWPDRVGIYRPVCGKTYINFVSFSNKDGVPDTIYGSFCGVMQNDEGDKLIVTDGKFYLNW